MYQFRTVTLKNGKQTKEVLVIEFTNPAMQIVGEFLMADASLLDYTVLKDIHDVLAKKVDEKQFSGNRCALTIKEDKTVIDDLWEGLYGDLETLPAYEMETVQLKKLIEMWKTKKEVFYKKNNSN
ncbi:hypothetical protein FHP05_08735 [Cerasibacillus terrae]|uniref:Uncharacterized protein n=1 Tax=Cerasibacillus terrae TaxID=2498845 RepID=A0A5C8NRS9_9BACI|nr:hypothetical protein [Cerasibacillus terrae]TXL64401.1 hypothetical protein FHP05_08735 [Cerasibacillus terrae]